MKKSNFAILMLTLLPGLTFSQETADSKNVQWEPQTHVTGYISSEFDYIKGLDRLDRDYAFSISEAGLLVNYQPLEKLTIKTVFVYRPNYSFDLMLNEVCGEYKVTDFLNLKVGRFLTPLSPMNTYYYAPVNNSATLPMLISHHEFFPLTMDALSLNGKIGNDFKIDYNGFWGEYRNTFRLPSGSLGFFGTEDDYITQDSSNVDYNSKLNVGKGGHLGISFRDNISIGGGVFDGKERVTTPDGTSYMTIDKLAYGFNAKFKFATLQLLAEMWWTDVSIPSFNIPIPVAPFVIANPAYKVHVKGSFFELSNSFGQITPYARYEHHNANNLIFDRYSFGLNYKPMFETIFKLEFMMYRKDAGVNNVFGTLVPVPAFNKNGLVATFIFSF